MRPIGPLILLFSTACITVGQAPEHVVNPLRMNFHIVECVSYHSPPLVAGCSPSDSCRSFHTRGSSTGMCRISREDDAAERPRWPS